MSMRIRRRSQDASVAWAGSVAAAVDGAHRRDGSGGVPLLSSSLRPRRCSGARADWWPPSVIRVTNLIDGSRGMTNASPHLGASLDQSHFDAI